MDSEQFEQLIAKLKSVATRRDALKGLIGGALISVGAAVPSRETRAQNRCKKNGKNCVDAQKMQYVATTERQERRRNRGN